MKASNIVPSNNHNLIKPQLVRVDHVAGIINEILDAIYEENKESFDLFFGMFSQLKFSKKVCLKVVNGIQFYYIQKFVWNTSSHAEAQLEAQIRAARFKIFFDFCESIFGNKLKEELQNSLRLKLFEIVFSNDPTALAKHYQLLYILMAILPNIKLKPLSIGDLTSFSLCDHAFPKIGNDKVLAQSDLIKFTHTVRYLFRLVTDECLVDYFSDTAPARFSWEKFSPEKIEAILTGLNGKHFALLGKHLNKFNLNKFRDYALLFKLLCLIQIDLPQAIKLFMSFPKPIQILIQQDKLITATLAGMKFNFQLKLKELSEPYQLSKKRYTHLSKQRYMLLPGPSKTSVAAVNTQPFQHKNKDDKDHKSIVGTLGCTVKK